MANDSVVYTIEVHHDPKHGYEAAVVDLPGCFAAGYTLDELNESLEEAIGLYLSTPNQTVRVSRVDEPEREERQEYRLCSA